jgi:SSS family solute:Na+ symporter
LWGVFACFIATQAVNLGALIEVVNMVGSYFYGSLLGVFVLAVATRANANGALAGLIVGMSSVAVVGLTTNVAYLWQNVIGTAVVVVVGLLVTMVAPGARPETTTLSSERGQP